MQALYQVDFHVAPGEVMSLVGDNGAGKSTLIKCIAGVYPVDEGEVVFEGEQVNIHGPKDSARLGIEVVYQDLALADNLNVVQNMYLGRVEKDRLGAWTRRPWRQRRRRPSGPVGRRDARAATRLRPVGRPAPVGRGRQGRDVELRVVILDEPTAALGVAQTPSGARPRRPPG